MPKEKFIQIRVPTELYEWLQFKATRNRLPLSTFVRNTLFRSYDAEIERKHLNPQPATEKE